MSDNIMQHKLDDVREWAQEKIQGGQEPPWAWYQYMKLVEAVDAILKGMSATNPTENLQQSGRRMGKPLRLVDATFQQDTSQPHQDDPPVQMPM